jgi:hypothetical protein
MHFKKEVPIKFKEILKNVIGNTQSLPTSQNYSIVVIYML